MSGGQVELTEPALTVVRECMNIQGCVMSVQPRGKIPEVIFMVVTGLGTSLEATYLYHSLPHARKLKEAEGGRLFKIRTADMTEILT